MCRKQDKSAFTMVEILIVVIILGILAAIVLPKFSNASATARASMLADDLRTTRSQMILFKSQHNDISPGCLVINGEGSLDLLMQHLTMASDQTGAVAAVGTDGYKFGPYLREFPTNPINGKNTVQIIANDATFPTTADDSTGWYYQPGALILKGNCAGVDENGKNYIDY